MMARAAGLLFDHYKAAGDITIGYGIMFVICAIAYLVAWIVMKILVPVHKPITDL
jgi:ACS family hexuronate transporter-like MFS transporter